MKAALIGAVLATLGPAVAFGQAAEPYVPNMEWLASALSTSWLGTDTATAAEFAAAGGYPRERGWPRPEA